MCNVGFLAGLGMWGFEHTQAHLYLRILVRGEPKGEEDLPTIPGFDLSPGVPVNQGSVREGSKVLE